MYRKIFTNRQTLRFKHFTRKGYALFSVLGREVLIGVLSVSTLTYAKADGISVNNVETANDSLSRKELKLDEVVITGSRVPLTQAEAAKMVTVISRADIDRAGAASVNDILKLATGVDVRQRGGFGVQTDISARGGNFDQITILLNGVNISSPHTGHLSSDFPVSPDDIERIEVIEGASSRLFGTSAFNGAVNIITKKEPKNSALVNAEAGSYGFFGTNGRATLVTGNVRNSFAVGYTRSDGATENSAFQNTRLFYEGSLTPNPSPLTLRWQIGYSDKPYEANTFYSPASRDQWEQTKRWMAAVSADITLIPQPSSLNQQLKIHLVPQVYINRWYDHYQWHRDSPAGENFHTVGAAGASINAWTEWTLGKTSLGLELRDERINSTNLGVHQRYNTSVFLEHDVLMKKWTFSLGLLANMNDGLDSKWRVYPGVDISYRPTESCKIFASWNMALRMPTFTELYYTAADMIGNSDLKPEKTNDTQMGVKYSIRGFRGELQLFYSHGTDMIDWVKYSAPESVGDNPSSLNLYHSVNFQRDNIGYEINTQLLTRELASENFPLRAFCVKYCYINENSKYDVNVIASKYAMEYLRHKLILTADATLWKISPPPSSLTPPPSSLVPHPSSLNLQLTYRWQDRVGEGNASYGLLDAKLSWDTTRYSVYINATNILNKQYYDYISIRQPGFCILSGLKFRF